MLAEKNTAKDRLTFQREVNEETLEELSEPETSHKLLLH